MSYPAADKYARRVVIAFDKRKLAKKVLAAKWIAKGYSADNFRFINLENTNEISVKKAEIQNAFFGINGNLLLYLVGHCLPGYNCLLSEEYTGNPETTFSVEMIAQLIADCVSSPHLKLRISLTACHAGMPNYNLIDAYTSFLVNNSFAARLQYQLVNRRIYCNIAARMGIVRLEKKGNLQKVVLTGKDKEFLEILNQKNNLSKNCSHQGVMKKDNMEDVINYGSKMEYLLQKQKTCYFPSKDIRSKVVYSYDSIQRKQVVLPAYEIAKDEDLAVFYELRSTLLSVNHRAKIFSLWKNEVLDTLGGCIDSTQSLAKKQGLQRLIQTILPFSDDDVHKMISDVLLHEKPNEGYHINTHSNWYGYGETNTAKELRELLVRRASYPQSLNTPIR